ncbi:MAG: DegT/DnrJ/EryC1/StrS family aminotransferase [bacterium]
MKIPFIDVVGEYRRLKISNIIQETFLRGDFILGKNVGDFEQKFAQYNDSKYCLGVASGTDALLLSLKALGIGPGDEVITTTFTFISTIFPIIYLGAKPVLVDINKDTFQIDEEKIIKAITPKTKAIIPVHLFGYPAPMDKICKIARKHKLFIVEDACQAHGSLIDGRKCGSIGNLGAFSFYPTKSLGAPGDGGAIITNSKKIENEVRALRNVGQFRKYKHDLIGYNSRLDSIHAGILLAKLESLDLRREKRKKLAKIYDKFLPASVVLPPGETKNLKPNYLIYTIRVKKRNGLQKFLTKVGISTMVYYPIPNHLQKALKYLNYKKGNFPVAEKVAKEVLSLPLFPELTEREVKFVCQKISEFFNR